MRSLATLSGPVGVHFSFSWDVCVCECEREREKHGVFFFLPCFILFVIRSLPAWMCISFVFWLQCVCPVFIFDS